MEKLDGPSYRHTVLAYNCLGGRVDQAFASIHTLYITAQLPNTEKRDLFLVSEDGVTFLLPKGVNNIDSPKAVFGPACGILPVGLPSVITTKGLMYDIKDWETSFGTKVSTSNYLEEDSIKIETKEPVVFTVEVNVKKILERASKA